MAGHFSNKALTTPVAMALALMMVVAASTALHFWVTRLQGQEQGSVESSQAQLFENLASCIDIPAFDYNTLDDTSNVVLQNCGNKKLAVGDSLLQDNGVVSSDPCGFILNSTTCDQCPFTLDVNTIKTFTLLWNQTTCVSKIEKGKKHQITLYIDNKASRSKTFVPQAITECGVSLTNITPLAVSNVGASLQAAYNLSLENTGNAVDVYVLTNATAGTNCDGVSVRNASASGSIITTISIRKGSTNIWLNQTMGSGGTGTCNATLTAASQNCLSKTASIIASTRTEA